MTAPRMELASMLAREILAFPDHARAPDPHPGAFDARIGQAHATIRLELESMVRGITKQVWVDTAAIASTVEAQIREAVSHVNLEAEIAKEITRSMAAIRGDLTRRIEARISELVERGIQDALGHEPQRLAKKIAARMWDRSFGDILPRRGDVYRANHDKPRRARKATKR